MIYICCTVCRITLRVSGNEEEIENLFLRSGWYPDHYPCPRCPNEAQYVEHVDSMAAKTVDMYDLTPGEAFAALNGLGLPDEQECGPTAVQKIFDDSKVKKVNARLVRGTNRSVLDSLEFEDGTRMFFGIGPEGATIYRIARKHSYAQEVLDEQG